MIDSVFVHEKFYILAITSILLPSIIFTFLFVSQWVPRWLVFLLAVVLLALSGIDLVLLHDVAEIAKITPSTLDDKLFIEGISVALYLLPAVFAGIGTNLLSHSLLSHLARAEKQFNHQRAHKEVRK